jgi:hypothetical protein
VASRLRAPALFSGNPETPDQVRQLLKEGQELTLWELSQQLWDAR